jgi:hypothetical protein
MRCGEARATVENGKEAKAMSTSVIDAPGRAEARPIEPAKWEYLLVPLPEAKGLKKDAAPWTPEQLNELGEHGWEAAGITLKYGDLMAWPVVLLKRRLT